MDKFESGRVKLFVHELRLKAITDVENKRGPGSVTADTFFEVLDSLPVPESQFETWWNSVKGTIQADAAAHFAAAAAGAAAGAPVLTAKQLLEFYAQKLMAHFSAEREQEVYRRFIALKQGTSKPSAFHSELKALHTELGSRVGAFELSERFEQGLHEKVRKHLDAHNPFSLSAAGAFTANCQRRGLHLGQSRSRSQGRALKEEGGLRDGGRGQSRAVRIRPAKAALLHTPRVEHHSFH